MLCNRVRAWNNRCVYIAMGCGEFYRCGSGGSRRCFVIFKIGGNNVLKIVVLRSPKLLRPIIRRIFGSKSDR